MGQRGKMLPGFLFGILLSALDTQVGVTQRAGLENSLKPFLICPKGLSWQL